MTRNRPTRCSIFVVEANFSPETLSWDAPVEVSHTMLGPSSELDTRVSASRNPTRVTAPLHRFEKK